jgi:predicted RNA-binding protein with PIN domain
VIIIDGHNLLHAILKIEEDPKAVSDIELCRVVSSYLNQTNQVGEIVFDGRGPRDKDVFERVDGIEVTFSGIRNDTDTIIEEKIKTNTAPKRLIIVSSDRRLRKAARSRKAIAVKSEDFWIKVQKQLSRKRPQKEPAAKRRGLSDSETKQWMKIFGIEQ